MNIPQVVGQVTDLDGGLAERALAGLRVELTRRKKVLQQFGVADISELPAGELSRLVVVFDEFRALTEELPDAITQLFRIAAQGRSLGIHLILATQRAAGAVSPELRANVSARLALRVVDVADSLDLVDSPWAASLPATPGRAVLRVGAEAAQVVQCAWVDAVPPPLVYRPDVPVTAQTPPMVPLVKQIAERYPAREFPRRAPLWLPPLPPNLALRTLLDLAERSCVPRFAQPQDDEWDDARPQDDEWGKARPQDDEWGVPSVEESRRDVSNAVLSLSKRPSAHLLGAETPIPVGLGDFVEEQAQRVVSWEPAIGPLGVIGAQATARTFALEMIGLAAAHLGWQVHWLGRLDAASSLARHPNYNGAISPAAAPEAVALLQSLVDGAGDSALPANACPQNDGKLPADAGPQNDMGAAGPQNDLEAARLQSDVVAANAGPRVGNWDRRLILIDNAERWRYLPRISELITEVSEFASIAISSNSPSCHGFGELITSRLIMLSNDPNENLLLGGPKKFQNYGTRPGRAIWQPPAGSKQGTSPILCQLITDAGE